MPSMPLAQSVRADFGSTGVARVMLSPAVYGEKWSITRVVISTTSKLTSAFALYMNSESPFSQLDTSGTGEHDTSETDIEMMAGDQLIGVWANGTPGAQAVMTLTGTKTTGR